MADPAAPRSLRFAKGAHLIVRLDEPWEAALTTPLEGGRVQFANPWEGALLVGTTDEPFEGDPRDLEVDGRRHRADRARVARVDRARASSSTTASSRASPACACCRRATARRPSARRETVFERGASGLLSIAGGKFTTFRRIALDALERLRGDLGLHRLDRGARAVARRGRSRTSSSSGCCATTRRSRPRARAHLARFHGSDAFERARARARGSRRCSSRSRPALPRSPRRCAGRASASGR